MIMAQMARPSTSTDINKLPKDEIFYCYPQVTIIAEDVVFRAPLQALWQSDLFIKAFTLPSQEIPLNECETKLHVVRLDGVRAAELRGFLKLLLQITLGHSTGEGELISALKLAHFWRFEAVHREAVTRLESCNLSSACKIQLAQLYSVPAWYGMEMYRLALRPDSISMEEAEQVGLKTMQVIASFRDARRIALQEIKESNGLATTKNLVQLFNSMAAIKISDMVIEHCKAQENPASYESVMSGIKAQKEAFVETIKQVRSQMQQDIQANNVNLLRTKELKKLLERLSNASVASFQPSTNPEASSSRPSSFSFATATSQAQMQPSASFVFSNPPPHTVPFSQSPFTFGAGPRTPSRSTPSPFSFIDTELLRNLNNNRTGAARQ